MRRAEGILGRFRCVDAVFDRPYAPDQPIGWGQEGAMHRTEFGHARTWLVRGRRLALLPVAILAVLAFAGTASAATPQRALIQARSAMVAVAHHVNGHKVKASANDAATRLAVASFSQLWSNPSEVVAPSFGTLVFTESAAAVNDIGRLARASVPGLAHPTALILSANRRVVQGVIADARGGSKVLLRAANRQLAAGDRDGAAGRSVAAVAHYAAAWTGAFKALTQLVTKAVTSVPRSAMAAAATNAI